MILSINIMLLEALLHDSMGMPLQLHQSAGQLCTTALRSVLAKVQHQSHMLCLKGLGVLGFGSDNKYRELSSSHSVLVHVLLYRGLTN